MTTNQLADNIEVTLASHGTFATTVAEVTVLERTSKRWLAHRIAEAYGGGCGQASTPTYWLRSYPKAVLAVVLGGLVAPTK